MPDGSWHSPTLTGGLRQVTVTVIVTVTVRLTLDELTARVADELHQLVVTQANGQVSAVPDGRTLRYYGTLGLLDRPIEVQGRRSLYGERHVLQAVAIKALQAEGLALQEIQKRLSGRTDAELLSLLKRPASTRFWRQPPTTDPPPSTDPAPSAIEQPEQSPNNHDPIAVRLGPGVNLVVDPARATDHHDLDALYRASTPLLAELRRLGLIKNEQESP